MSINYLALLCVYLGSLHRMQNFINILMAFYMSNILFFQNSKCTDSSFMTYHQVCNMTGVRCGAETAYPSTPHSRILVEFSHVARSLVFCVVTLFVRLIFFLWSLCCLFFDLQLLITPLVSSNCFLQKVHTFIKLRIFS